MADEVKDLSLDSEDEVLEIEEDDDTNSNDNDNNKEDGKEKSSKPKQSKELNAYYKQKRLNAKEQPKDDIEEAKRLGTKEGILRALHNKNPFTNEKIEDDADYEELVNMLELQERGSEDVVEDYRKYIKDKKREQLKQEKAKKDSENKVKEDVDDFNKKFGDKYKVSEIIKDKDFLEFCKIGDDDTLLGTTPLAKLFSLYLKQNGKLDNEPKQPKQEDIDKNADGSLKGNKTGTSENYFTMDEIRAMSQAQVNKNIDKINKSISYWRNKK